MRKLFLSGFSLLMILSLVLAGCGGGNGKNESNAQQVESGNNGTEAESEPAKKVKLSILSWNNEKEMKPVLDGFTKKYPNITFDFSNAPPVKDYIAKLQSMLLSDSATDIFIIAAENRNEIIDGGYALDLTDQPFMDTMIEANKPMLSKDGRTYAFTQTGWAGGLFYNKQLFEQAGIASVPRTWDEFIAASLKLKEAGIIPLYDNMQDVTTIHSGLFANLTLSQDPEFDRKLFEGETTFAEGWTETFRIWKRDLIDNGILKPDMIGLTGDQIVNEFALGNVAMFPGGPWNINTLEETNPDLEFGMMAVPGVNAAGGNYFAGAPGVGFAVNSKTKFKEEALLFLEYLASPEGLKAFEEGTGSTITAKGYESQVHPALEEAYRNGLLANKIYLPMVAWPRNQEALRGQFVVSIQDLAVGKVTPEQVTEALDKKLKEMENK
ncbi:MAG TPA: extracellular solute-binding protein [Paenibacillus sp.]|uniref:ABC transporter substrate-binding protein n=1 Tax=Paenibacillus sp. TaxID=58172 RepID=UPI002C1C1118|nr:extracellular solute-binding protein [Paenibacillus sp.]HUC93701.1 extracellular solute-binding protein [Paenibacillus sp.]